MPTTPAVILGTMTFGYHGYGSRIHDDATAEEMLEVFAGFGHRQVDTAHAYGDGSCEEMLGNLGVARRFSLATRVDPGGGGGHGPERLEAAFRRSLERLKTSRVDIFYLTLRDSATPFADTMAAVDALHREGLFDEFGLSNFAAWEVADIQGLAAQHGWVAPSVYQGMYNALTRGVEPELFACLAHYGMRFHAYNPLAGGAFRPGFGREESVGADSRFDTGHLQGRTYRQRFWNDEYLAALEAVQVACAAHDLDPITAALRWLVHHSCLDAARGDGIIVGASSVDHIRHNLDALRGGPLPDDVVAAIDEGSERARPRWPSYFFSS